MGLRSQVCTRVVWNPNLGPYAFSSWNRISHGWPPAPAANGRFCHPRPQCTGSAIWQRPNWSSVATPWNLAMDVHGFHGPGKDSQGGLRPLCRSRCSLRRRRCHLPRKAGTAGGTLLQSGAMCMSWTAETFLAGRATICSRRPRAKCTRSRSKNSWPPTRQRVREAAVPHVRALKGCHVPSCWRWHSPNASHYSWKWAIWTGQEIWLFGACKLDILGTDSSLQAVGFGPYFFWDGTWRVCWSQTVFKAKLQQHQYQGCVTSYDLGYVYWLVLWNMLFSPYIGNHIPTWLSQPPTRLTVYWLFAEGLKPPTSIGYVFTRVCTKIPMSFAADPAGIGRQDLHRRGWHRRYRRDAVPSRRQIEGATGLGAQGEGGGCWKVRKTTYSGQTVFFMSIW